MIAFIYRLSRWTAILGGVMLCAIMLMIVLSVSGRALIGVGLGPIPGDFELVEVGTAIAVFFFLPWTYLKGGHATVDLLYTHLPAWAKRAVLLVTLRAPASVQRLHDDLRYHQVYRQFIGFDHGMAWSPLQCMRLLQACATPLLRRCVDDTLARVPSSLLDAACVTNACRVGDRLQEQRI